MIADGTYAAAALFLLILGSPDPYPAAPVPVFKRATSRLRRPFDG